MQRMDAPVRTAAFDGRQLRNALGRYATGVAIVTARGMDRQFVGLTVNSFSSVSLEPPLVLWSLANTSASLPHFKEAGHFAVHVLAEDQIDLARRFASNVPQRFDGVPVVEGEGCTPLLQGCPVRFHCETVSVMEAGDNHIFLGQVVGLEESDAAGDSLLFYRGRFQCCSRNVDLTPSD